MGSSVTEIQWPVSVAETSRSCELQSTVCSVSGRWGRIQQQVGGTEAGQTRSYPRLTVSIVTTALLQGAIFTTRERPLQLPPPRQYYSHCVSITRATLSQSERQYRHQSATVRATVSPPWRHYRRPSASIVITTLASSPERLYHRLAAITNADGTRQTAVTISGTGAARIRRGRKDEGATRADPAPPPRPLVIPLISV